MKKYIIDTNALLSFVTDRNAAQQRRIAEIFEGAARLKWLVVCPLGTSSGVSESISNQVWT